jgi:hypothetical protein
MQLDAVTDADGAGVMTGRHPARAQTIGEKKELGHFNAAIAGHARARRRAGQVGIDERLDDLARKQLSPVERVARCRGGRLRDARRAGLRARSIGRERSRHRGNPRDAR